MKNNSIADDLFLASLLKKCKESGYIRVGISDQSITGQPLNKTHGGRIDGWPAIWSIVEKLGIDGGAGNSHQHQVSWSRVKDINHKNIMGIYKLNSKGLWKKEIGKQAGMFQVDMSTHDYAMRKRGYCGD